MYIIVLAGAAESVKASSEHKRRSEHCVEKNLKSDIVSCQVAKHTRRIHKIRQWHQASSQAVSTFCHAPLPSPQDVQDAL